MDIKMKARGSEYLGLDGGPEGMIDQKSRSNANAGMIKA